MRGSHARPPPAAPALGVAPSKGRARTFNMANVDDSGALGLAGRAPSLHAWAEAAAARYAEAPCPPAVLSMRSRKVMPKHRVPLCLARSESCRGLGQADCAAKDGCEWCVSAAVPSACYDAADAAKLPSSVFHCSGAAA